MLRRGTHPGGGKKYSDCVNRKMRDLAGSFCLLGKISSLSLPPLPMSQIFNDTVAGVVDGIVNGFNGTVLCVGRRGSGTYAQKDQITDRCF